MPFCCMRDFVIDPVRSTPCLPLLLLATCYALRDSRFSTRNKVWDLNADPRLPFDDAAYDAVVCTVSVQYLQQPEAVFADVQRVLK